MNKESTVDQQNTNFGWIKLQEFITVRRGTMYRFLSSSLQLLLLGNAGGVGFILGLFPSGAEPQGIHWFCVLAIMAFMFGILSSAATLVCITALTIKEANASETALYQLIHKKITLEEAILFIDNSGFRIAASAMVTGILSVLFLVVGAAVGIVLLALYY